MSKIPKEPSLVTCPFNLYGLTVDFSFKPPNPQIVQDSLVASREPLNGIIRYY